ncbi:DUF1624 domain-containing protein [Arthrobacter sp. CAU 1506]|uniref:heparan-alpha-glucosaminide N-acetyltransferase domain-containing protein n=1 Tax=Arthrobacter sp. CAU 1506 TaxID=2560052 RepID=UPI0010AD802B|nr:heparan-alpha-glucosaminide N-acetyltransferase domain-containing protein [Arthrobacter sp. CAU 1506]TJY72184.1 DUF1624 domain-containing protein [Arthrobacter sp. CAU 1506]
MPSVPAGHRIAGIDAARGIALLGMMATHIFAPWTAGTDPEPNFVGLVLSGRSSALFAVLAGVGLALLTGGSRGHQGGSLAADRGGIAVRALLIATVGMMLGLLEVNIAVILVHYAVLFLCALPFLQLRRRVLALWAAGWIVLSPVLAHLLRPVVEAAVEPAELGHNPMVYDLITPATLLSDVFLTGYYPVVQWLGYLLAGLLIGRMELQRTGVQLGLLAVGAVLAVAAKTGSWLVMDRMGGYAEVAATEPAQRADFDLVYQVNMSWVEQRGSWWWLGGASPHSGTSFDLLHTVGTSAVVLALCLLLTSRLPWLLLPLSGAGAMTLTLYSAHVWVMSTLPPDAPDLPVYLWQALAAIAIGMVFHALGWRGPFELVISTASWLTRDALRPTGSRSR